MGTIEYHDLNFVALACTSVCSFFFVDELLMLVFVGHKYFRICASRFLMLKGLLFLRLCNVWSHIWQGKMIIFVPCLDAVTCSILSQKRGTPVLSFCQLMLKLGKSAGNRDWLGLNYSKKAGNISMSIHCFLFFYFFIWQFVDSLNL